MQKKLTLTLAATAILLTACSNTRVTGTGTKQTYGNEPVPVQVSTSQRAQKVRIGTIDAKQYQYTPITTK